MLEVFKRLLMPAIIAGSAASANAITWQFATTTNQSMQSERISWATLTILNVGPDEVEFTLTNNAARPNAFISDLWLNLAVIPPDLAADFSGPIRFMDWKPSGDSMANMGQRWDLNVDFFKNSANRLSGGESVTWTMTGTGLDETDFDASSTARGPHKDGELGMIHFQGLGKEGASKVFVDPQFVMAPEPGTMAALGLGALVLVRKRRKR